MALREVVPSAVAALTVVGHEDRAVTVTTALPFQWPAVVAPDGGVALALQVASRSGDAGRDLAAVLLGALSADSGPVSWPDVAGPGPRLPDLLAPQLLAATLQPDFSFWRQLAPDPDGELAAAADEADASILPTVRVPGVESAYWCRLREREQLRWVLPQEEEALLDALARLAVTGGLMLGPDSRHLGSFRAHGLLVGVWDLPAGSGATAIATPAAAFTARLTEVLAESRPLNGAERRARAGLLSRQITLR